MRFLTRLGAVLSLWATALAAQEPQISVEVAQDEVPVGQPVMLRIEVIVPTFMPQPPIFPTFEAPGLIVRLPERSTSPISPRVGGATWSGVRRTYRIYPMQAGVTQIPAQMVSIIYKDPETNEDVDATLEVPEAQITATVPEAAAGLNPLIIARALTVTQSWEVAEGELAVGDAVTRRLEIEVAGTSALFVPPLLETAAPMPDGETAAGFAAYPADPRVTESDDRGVMSGARREEVSYIAQSGGAAVFPDITLSWYNIDKDTVEDIVLEGRGVRVAIPPEVAEPIDRAALMRMAVFVLLGAAILWAVYRWVWPYLHAAAIRLRQRYHDSLYAAQRQAEACAQARDLTALNRALDIRSRRGRAPGAQTADALSKLTRAIYRDGQKDPQTAWRAVAQALRRERGRLLNTSAANSAEVLPPLNAFAPKKQ